MAVFTSSVLSMRKKLIIEALRESGARTPESAKALAETDIINPDSFPEFTKQLADTGVIKRTADGKYYVDGNN